MKRPIDRLTDGEGLLIAEPGPRTRGAVAKVMHRRLLSTDG